MVINTNIQAQAAAANLQNSSAMLSKSLARLSSGSKIVNPADDAAGLAVASRLDAQVKRLGAAKSNVGNAISFTQTQDGYLKKLAKAYEKYLEAWKKTQKPAGGGKSGLGTLADKFKGLKLS